MTYSCRGGPAVPPWSPTTCGPRTQLLCSVGCFPPCVPILKTSAWEPNVPPNDFLIPPICTQEPFDLRHSLIYIFMVLPSSMRSCVLSPPSNANFPGSPTSYPLILPFSNSSLPVTKVYTVCPLPIHPYSCSLPPLWFQCFPKGRAVPSKACLQP